MFPDVIYPWVKALHVIAVISWMAGMLYLPRLFVYHCQSETGSVQSETFKIMERRLMRIIMTPAMIVSWLAGLVLITFQGGAIGWLHAKLLMVLGMTAVHGAMASWVKAFAQDRNTRPQRFFRIANEVPTLLMIIIVILVIVKPF